METIYSGYANEGVDFYFVYKQLAHPGMHGYLDAYNVPDRLAHIQEAKRTLDTHIPWITDNQLNELFDSLGKSYNAEFVVDPHGEIVRMRDWSAPAKLREDLLQLVGPASATEPVSRSNAKYANVKTKFPRAVLPRVAVPRDLKRAAIEPQSSQQPFYAKLIAKAQSDLVTSGSGALSLEFVLDPIHPVHWNNRAPALSFELREPESGKVLFSGEAPRADVDADIDPRCVLVDLKGIDSGRPIQLDVHYVACDNADKWCKYVSQSYAIRFTDFGN